jgi:hypothetical protein
MAVGLLAVAAAALLLVSTRWGIGISADGTAYLGFRPHDVGHAPLYSGLMRLLRVLPFDVDALARLYHAAVYAATAGVSWLLVRDATGRALPAWAGALLIVFASQALQLYSMALSEPTFVLLVVLGLWSLSAWVDRRRLELLVFAAAATALATLARYPGVALVATGAMTVFAASGPTLMQRVMRAATFACAAVVPALAWMAYVARVTGTAAGRQTALAGTADTETFYGGLLEAARYVLPTEFPVAARIAALAAVLVLLAIATLAFYRRTPVAADRGERQPHRWLPLIVLTFFFLYSAVVVLAVLVEPYLPITDRYLYPAYVALVLLGATTVPALSQSAAARRAVAVAVLGFVALSTVRAAKVAADGYTQGWGYAAEAWRSSPVVAYVNALPGRAVVYSDDPYALLYLTQHEVHGVPNAIKRRAGSANPNYERDIAAMVGRLRSTSGVIVIFERDRGEFVAPVLPQLANAVALEERKRFDDATVYVLAEQGAWEGY